MLISNNINPLFLIKNFTQITMLFVYSKLLIFNKYKLYLVEYYTTIVVVVYLFYQCSIVFNFYNYYYIEFLLILIMVL